jgi:hypothetical protein
MSNGTAMITEARMSKKQNKQRQFGPPAKVVVERIEVIEPPKPRAFEPRPCSACEALRPKTNENYSYVYHTRGTVRYCKCKFCGNTWSQSQ